MANRTELTSACPTSPGTLAASGSLLADERVTSTRWHSIRAASLRSWWTTPSAQPASSAKRHYQVAERSVRLRAGGQRPGALAPVLTGLPIRRQYRVRLRRASEERMAAVVMGVSDAGRAAIAAGL